MKTLPEYLFAEESIPHCQNQPKDRINLARGRNGDTELVGERHDDVVADDWSPSGRSKLVNQPLANPGRRLVGKDEFRGLVLCRQP